MKKASKLLGLLLCCVMLLGLLPATAFADPIQQFIQYVMTSYL